jgi:hypothetical protein
VWKRLDRRFGIPAKDSQILKGSVEGALASVSTQDNFRKALILSERNFLNYIRNILAFGIRSKFFLPFLSYY